jgi:hypothetical protein
MARLRVTLSPLSGSAYGVSSGTIHGFIFSAVPPAPVALDGTFAIAGIAPAAFSVRCQMPPDASSGWWLRSVMVGGRDAQDAPLDFALGASVTDAVITFTDRHNELSGALQGASGLPAPEYVVVVFPADRALWQSRRRVRTTRPATDGAFSVGDLPAGAYLLAALTDFEPSDADDSSFFERLVPQSVPVTLTEGERKVQNIRVAGGS